ncbi:MAG: DUF4160 domain-containing protein [Acidobacteria bacterium]|nr:DUF4160 domain-containing protein [Acidobacteriota bacterium]
MPRISAFYGIVISMYFNDHAPPHFHAIYGEREAKLSIETSEILEGSLPRRAGGLVREWASLHSGELARNWARARDGFPLDAIEPLP